MGIRIGRVRLVSSGWQGGPGLNTFYFAGQAAGVLEDIAATDVQRCVDRVHNAVVAANILWPITWRGTTSPTMDVLDAATGELVDSFTAGAPPVTAAGNGAAGFGPSVAMMLLQLRTNTFSDGSRLAGRAFMGPVNPSSDGDGSPTIELYTRTALFGTALLDEGIGAENPSVVVWRRPRLASAGPPAISARAGSIGRVTAFTVPDRYSVLKSRRD